jgi:hypothetical protein
MPASYEPESKAPNPAAGASDILGLASGVAANESEEAVTELFLFLSVTTLAVAWMMIRAAMEDENHEDP